MTALNQSVKGAFSGVATGTVSLTGTPLPGGLTVVLAVGYSGSTPPSSVFVNFADGSQLAGVFLGSSSTVIAGFGIAYYNLYGMPPTPTGITVTFAAAPTSFGVYAMLFSLLVGTFATGNSGYTSIGQPVQQVGVSANAVVADFVLVTDQSALSVSTGGTALTALLFGTAQIAAYYNILSVSGSAGVTAVTPGGGGNFFVAHQLDNTGRSTLPAPTAFIPPQLKFTRTLQLAGVASGTTTAVPTTGQLWPRSTK